MTDAAVENRAIILHLEDVSKEYDNKVILDDIDLRVAETEFVTLVGPSGCGKSTLLRLILGQEPVTTGVIFLFDRPIGHPNIERGIVYQKYSLFPNLTALQNVVLGKKYTLGFLDYIRKRRDCIEEAEYLLGKVRLEEHIHKYPHQLSGGQRQRVAIAQALIMNHKILLMDEPFGALDPFTREELQVFLVELWEEQKMTIFFVTHDLEEAVFLGTRIIILSQYYSDDRGHEEGGKRGARIVYDSPLSQKTRSRSFKQSSEFRRLIAEIRYNGFNPENLQHVTDFNLAHRDSFQTLTEEVHRV